jgi:hypothetical protein
METDREQRIDSAARSFVAAATTSLTRDHVLPRPDYLPHIRMARDYFGAQIALPETTVLETVVAESHIRFSDDTPLGSRDFAGSYVSSFLEACVARATTRGEALTPNSTAVDDSVRDLVRAVLEPETEVAVCRHVAHLTTSEGEPLNLGDVTIMPVVSDAAGHRRTLGRIFDSVIAGAASAWDSGDGGGFAPRESVVVARADAEGTDFSSPFKTAEQLSASIEKFLEAVRLLHASTCYSLYEIQGETRLVRRYNPTVLQFRGDLRLHAGTKLIMRPAVLDEHDLPRIVGLSRLLAEAESVRAGMVLTSYAMALTKFRMSFHAHTWWEQVVDLATAFEATLSGRDRSDVLLRLRTRAAALLATKRDPASAIFQDIGKLYDLRSRLVHGGEMKEKDLVKLVHGITTVPDDAWGFGTALNHAVDRLRDLVRRGLLARVALAAPEARLWALEDDAHVDAALADDDTRRRWRGAIEARLTAIGALELFDRPPPARDALLTGS